MDVRLFAFLARQRSARIQPREYFCGLPKRALALLLANVMFWQPLWAQAEGIAVSGAGTSLGQAGNGVPIVNIAAPNGSGLSHNQFSDYNVGQQGLILNNATDRTASTQLGGIILGNGNLQGRAAQIILNEVNGANASQLRGYTEVAGQGAHVIVANPHGISCDGCGFINTPRATLSTGTPVISNGQLTGYRVDQGQIAIEGAGVNANNVDSFELIARSARINAEIQARNLTIIAGRNDVDAHTLAATARADDGSARPALAIDSSALGGMYAGAVKLVGTEAGVGVRLDGQMIASGGDIQLDANGQLRMNQASASGNVRVQARAIDAQGPVHAGQQLQMSSQGDLVNRQGLTAAGQVQLSAGGQLSNLGGIQAGIATDGSRVADADLKISAGAVDNRNQKLIASRDLAVNAGSRLDNQGGSVNAGRNVVANAATVDNRKGRIASQATLSLAGGSLDNSSGQLYSDAALTVRLDQVLDNLDGVASGEGLNIHALALNNQRGVVTSDAGLVLVTGAGIDNQQGEISSSGDSQLRAASLDNRKGVLSSNQTLQLDLNQALDNRNGVVASGQALAVNAASLDNREQGKVLGEGSVTAKVAGLLDNQGNGLISGQGATEIDAGQLDNRGGRLVGKALLTLKGQQWDNRGGRINAAGALTLTVDRLDNRDQGLVSGQALVRYSGTELLNRLGVFGAQGDLYLQAEHLDNSGGSLTSAGDLDGRITRVEQLGGKLSANGQLGLLGSSLVNQQGGVVGAGQGLRLTVANVDNRGGELSAAQTIGIDGQQLDNSGGQVLAGTDLALTVGQVINQAQGLLRATRQLTLDGQALDNRSGRLSGVQGTRLQLSQALDNGKGLITTEGNLAIGAASLDNRDATLTSAGTLTLATTGALDNQRGSITADGALDLRSGSLDNRAGELGAQGAIDLATGALDNRDNGHVVSNDRLTLKAGQVSNAGSDSRIDSVGALSLSASGFDQQAGRLLSNTSITLDLGQGALVNHGLIKAPVLVLNHLGSVDNQRGIIASPQAFSLAATTLDNRQGQVLSDAGLTVRIAQALANAKGLVSANGLDLRAASLDNQGGVVSSRGNLALAIDGRLDNRQGTLVSDAASQFSAAVLDNSQGQVSSKGRLDIDAGTLVNTAGTLIGLDQLQVKGAQLDNRAAGLLGSNGALTLSVGQVDNRGGEITGKAGVEVTGSLLDNSDGGLLVAGSGLTLALQQLLNRNQGAIEAQGGLTLSGATLDNDGGRLTSQQDMTLTLTGEALNRLGMVSAEGQLALMAQRVDNSSGQMSSAGQLRLTSQGELLNQGGELLGDADIVLASASLVNTDRGVVSSKGALAINTGHLDNSRQGSLSSNRTLDLRAGQLDNRDGGRIGSREALTATLTGLDQQGGKLFSDSSVHLDLNQGQLDNRGGLINAPLLVLHNLNGVANQGGEISSAQAFSVDAKQLDNSNGRLLSNQGLMLRVKQRLDNLKGLIGAQALDVHAGSLDNSGGTLSSQGGMQLAIDGLLTNRGLIEARGALALSSQGLDNRDGKVLGSAIDLTLGGGDLDNTGGLITTAGQLTVKQLGTLINPNGELSTAQALQLDASAVDNRAGKLISEQTLALTSGAVDNQGGLISGWQGLTVSGQRLDNRQQGTLSSRAGSVQANIGGALRNSEGGALVAQQRLDVSAASLDNSAKGVLSSAGAQHLAVTAALDNHDGGLIDAGEQLDIDAQTLDNRGGRVAAQQALKLSASRLDNSAGSFIAQGDLTLDLLGDLINRQGKLASGKALLIQRANQVDNQGGEIASQGLLKLLAASVDNSQHGTLAASGLLTLTSNGAVNNAADGLIYSQQSDVNLQAASLDNSNGTVQASGALSVKSLGDFANQRGKLIAQDGTLDLGAANVDNRGGTLASLKRSLAVRTTGVLRNGSDAAGQRGILQALSLDLQSASLDNHGGRIAALTGDALIRTGQLDNRDGGVSAGGLLKVTGSSLLNGGDARGEMVGQRIELGLTGALDNRSGIIESSTTFAISAASLDNQGGQLRALGTSGQSQFAIGGLFDNRAGVVEVGNTDLTLGAGVLQNVGGRVLHAGSGVFDIDTLNLTRAGGSLITRGGLTLTADTWTNGSAIQAGRLTVNVNNLTQTADGQLLAFDSLVGNGGNWSNDGLIVSDGDLRLNLGGLYSGNGRVSSLGTLWVSAAQMDLGSNASITGVGNTTVNVTGQLNNQGRMSTAGDLLVNAGSLNNLGTLGGNQLVRVTTGSLRNDHGLLFSGQDMQLYTGSLTNFYGDVYSLGGLTVARDGAGNLADLLDNVSGSLESAGDMRLSAARVDNRKEFIKTSSKLVSSAIGLRSTAATSGHFVLQEHYENVLEADSQAARIAAGQDLVMNGGDFTNDASVVTAGRNLLANFDDFNNVGRALGSYSTLRSFNLQGQNPDFWSEAVHYNAANDPDYRLQVVDGSRYRGGVGTFRHWDAGWNESTVAPRLTSSPQAYEETMSVGWYRSWGWRKGVEFFHVAPSYNSGVRAALPASVANASFFDTRTLSDPNTGTAINAVVQAGNLVQINARQNLSNSVVQQSQPVGTPTGRSFDPQLPGAGNNTVITVHSQLPPDLARQQVNPLDLGGFTLPIGQNGLFRLSGQGGNAATVSGQRWDLGTGSVTTQSRQGNVPGSMPGGLQAANAGAYNLTDSDIADVAHQGRTVGGRASALVVNAPGDTAVDFAMPQRHANTGGDLGINIPGVTRFPASQYVSKPQKYLIETNPVLTELKQFMSSDYLLGSLGYDPDNSWKRLGDGLYEQRLVQQAVVARTGQQFIDGKTSGEQQFKYLMDNAIRSKDELNLSVGVGLTAAQVAALTHDIVWMEQHVVNGEAVLVPVLYLANADNRLAPNGALIAGQDVELIAGEDLSNVGTLRASRNLTATAGNDLVNGGLIEAGERLDLLAGNNLVNSAGGIIAGRDVSLTAVNGDILNQRDQQRHSMTYGGITNQWDYLDNVARIEASNSLELKAGQDIKNIGSVIQSGGDLSLSAGRDISVLAVEQREGFYSGSQRNSTVQQSGATLEAGRDLSIGAGRDISAVASQIDAGRDIAMAAGGDLNLTSAADEAHSFSRSKKVTQSKDLVTQVSTTLNAGGDILLSAGQDMAIVASQVKGKGDVDIDAERDLTIASDQDESASYYLKKSKGSFGRSSSTQKESYHSTNVASVIEAGGDLTVNVSKTDSGGIRLDGGRDVSVIGSQLKAGGDLMLGATGDVAVLSGVEEHGEYSKKTKSGFLGLSKSGKSQLKTSATQVGSELNAGNDVVIAAGSDVRLRASEANAGNDVELRAGLIDKEGDINLVSANDAAYSYSDSYKKKVGISVSPGAVVIPSVSVASAKKAGQEARSSTSVASQVLAERDATLQAERDINLLGSGVNAGRNVSLNAGRDVNVAAAENQSDTRNWSQTSKVGLSTSADDNGIKAFAGVEKEIAKDRLREQLASASQIKAGQDLDIKAGRDINQTGSDLVAGHDISLDAGRDINIDAARETRVLEQEREYASQGVGGSINHNFGKTKDALSNAGKGENAVSQGSSTLQAVDSLNQFLAGPTGDVKIGNSSQKSQQTSIEQSNRGSSLDAGNDIRLQAGNDVTITGSGVKAGRDLDIKGRDINIDVAHGSSSQSSRESQNWAGISGGSSGGLKVGIGASHGAAGADGTQGTSSPSQLEAGRDVRLDASHDLNIVGSEVKGGRDVELAAGNELNIRAAQNDSRYEQNRHSGGGEVGLAFGSEGIGVYASVNLGKGNLEREAQRHQEAYVYAGDQLKFTSGKDTNIQGAQLRGDEVIGRVGGDLNVASAVDTGKVKGKEFDLSATVTIGPGSGISGSVGYGKTTGKTEWVEDQTRITGRDKVDIRTEHHTQLDGALIAADNGNLKLDTGTLGYSDIAGKDQEHGYYLNVGGSWKQGSGTTQQDASQQGKGEKGENGWSVSGWEYEKDREQIVRATVGAGEITVRQDAGTGQDSTVGLNRDLDKAYEITRDKESRTDLYVTDSSLHDSLNPKETLQKWSDGLLNYDETALKNFEAASVGINATLNRLDRLMGRQWAPGVMGVTTREFAEQTLEQLILSGKSRSEAMALMADENFQNNVLGELSRFWNIKPETIAEAKEIVDQAMKPMGVAGTVLLPETTVYTKELTLLQDSLRSMSYINDYIENNPEKAQAIGIILALTQGPKGVVQAVAMSAAEQTPLGQALMERLQGYQDYVGQKIAEYMEGKDLSKDEKFDRLLMGGGNLIASIIGTGISSMHKGGTEKAPNEGHAHKPDGKDRPEAKGGEAPDPQAGDTPKPLSKLEKLANERMDEIISQFADKSQHPKDFKLTIDGKTLKTDPKVSDNAPVFIGASDDMVKSYFLQLGGVEHLPPVQTISIRGESTNLYVLTREDGVKINLRDRSSSGMETGANWTIDIIKHPDLKAKKVEVKFK
ncbi:hemagglutinin repeat-containing protein [Pseudomonas vlassakiae]|uniref:Hemagglutinin repeat-containing protein n=1 Tax=Pseudomonas vlassakiae TaxID=485888 RepID=A0A923GLP8_9PSED|nr:hemagglutinin repeat-containing protein [Pseudomonas vlassakiae]MBV4542851.1 hemagglutinin repeat-containing protein [Pseudomonas vlassakiae]